MSAHVQSGSPGRLGMKTLSPPISATSSFTDLGLSAPTRSEWEQDLAWLGVRQPDAVGYQIFDQGVMDTTVDNVPIFDFPRRLREGLLFHDGEKVDAAAVKFSLDRALTLPDSRRKSEIAAIQAATRSTVETNISIRQTVDAARNSALRIRSAMEEQARTVDTITAAIDEGALAADTMAATVDTIRDDTHAVVGEIVCLGAGFSEVGDRLAQLQRSAESFSASVG